MLDDYFKQKGKFAYAELNEVVGVLECAKIEFARRLPTSYEDGKIAENGDVYTVTESLPHLPTR